jgi:hypothetical protein
MMITDRLILEIVSDLQRHLIAYVTLKIKIDERKKE